ncbi:hypothetical protein IQ225_18205 [Synechocystis salina LEGE 06155]|nr:hypothetical protein [Synechocystis salina LEGE 06155]
MAIEASQEYLEQIFTPSVYLFKISEYQRPYSWEKERVDALSTDLIVMDLKP